MADDLKNRGKADRDRISLTEEWELRYWTDALDVTEAQLRDAVAGVGPMAADVRKHLEGEGEI